MDKNTFEDAAKINNEIKELQKFVRRLKYSKKINIFKRAKWLFFRTKGRYVFENPQEFEISGRLYDILMKSFNDYEKELNDEFECLGRD